MRRRVFVGMSGGVDSSVSAALLKQEGYDVTGVFIKIWQPEFKECTWKEDRLDVMRVCAHLSIPFCEVDLSAEYKHDVIDPMIEGYSNGITPNPDIWCNERVKFGHFFEWAIAEGADCVATGHYAQRVVDEATGKPTLVRGIDTEKDQSYFLSRITERALDASLFPVGAMHKKDVRALAASLHLPVAKKKDSQGLCFVGAVTMSDFLSRYIPLQPGNVCDTEGYVVGSHSGVGLYTIGQRHGFQLHKNQTSSTPFYIVEIRVAENVLVVSPELSIATRSHIPFTDVHIIDSSKGLKNKELLVQPRYREQPVAAHMEGGAIITKAPILVSPGQTLALYAGNQCLGGAIAA